MTAFPQSEGLRKALMIAAPGAAVIDHLTSKQAKRIEEMRSPSNIYLKQAELYRREADKLRAGSPVAAVQVPLTGSKYLAEEGASPDTDCFSCATAHLAGTEGALRRAAQEAKKEGGCGPDCQKWMNIAAQEPAAMLLRDWTPEKRQKLPPDQRALLDRYAPKVEEIARKITPAPEGEGVLRAAALLKESVRFAEAGDDVRHPEVESRRLAAEAELAAAERLRPGSLHPSISQSLRQVRRRVGSGITDTKSLIEAAKQADELSLNTNSHTWHGMHPRDLERLADEVHTIRARFAEDRARMGSMHFISPSPIGPERHHTIPKEVIEEYTSPGIGQMAGLSKQQVKTSFDSVLERLEARGVKVRYRDLPVTMEWAIEGAYTPDHNAIVLNASKMARDNYALQTIFHEGTHSLLHNRECHPTVSKKPYSEMPEEIEAHVASMAAMLDLGVPVEGRFGEEIKPGEIKIDWNKIKEKAGPQAEENIKWAAQWLVRAARGEDSGLAGDKCPALASAGVLH
jgi:hypothetical protein